MKQVLHMEPSAAVVESTLLGCNVSFLTEAGRRPDSVQLSLIIEEVLLVENFIMCNGTTQGCLIFYGGQKTYLRVIRAVGSLRFLCRGRSSHAALPCDFMQFLVFNEEDTSKAH